MLKIDNCMSFSNDVRQPERGCHVLKATSYARKVPVVHDAEDWEGYILLVLKALRSADKANWHHRMVARVSRFGVSAMPFLILHRPLM